MRKWMTCLILSFFFTHFAYAQADHIGNGGDWSEAELKHFLARLAPYLQSDEGKQVFPEIVRYDQGHGIGAVERVINELNPRLVNQPVYDSSGNERDCVSYVTPTRYFECNLNSLPRKPSENATNEQKSEYYGSMYRLVLHEVFVQIGLEKPLAKEVPSAYTYSSSLMVHLEAFPEWVPGTGLYSGSSRNDIIIHNLPEWSIGAEVGSLLHTVGTGLNLQLQFPVTIESFHFKLGMSTGFEYGFSSPYRSWAVPIFATLHYSLPEIMKIRLYVKVGAGVIITHQTQDLDSFFFNDDGGLAKDHFFYTSTDTNLSFSFTPGFYFGAHDGYFFEVPIRTMEYPKGMSIMPTLGVHF